MLVTEEQAKSRWCPAVRVLQHGEDGSPSTGNRLRTGEPDRGSKCVGSDCMWWRWTLLNPAVNLSLGYCGAAGIPLQVDRP